MRKKKVLLLGDSIRLSYQPIVGEILKNKSDVVGPSSNCRFSLYTLTMLDEWLEELGTPDIVHWNNGLHDIGHNPFRSPVQIPLDMYISNLQFTLNILKKTKANIIWATTTPVHPDRPFTDKDWAWKNEEISLYNESSLAIMNQYNIPVNDLNSIVGSNIDKYLSEDKLHLSELGQIKCGQAVAKAVGHYIEQ